MIHSSEPRQTQIRDQNYSMAAYDTRSLTISSMTAAPDILRLSTPELQHQMLEADMDVFQHDLNFEGDTGVLLGDTAQNGMPSLPFTPSYEFSDAFSTTFEDPFSYPSNTDFSSLLEDTTMKQQSTDASSTAAELDNKLLGFGAPILKAPVLDAQGQSWPQMSAELYGMFFVAEDVFGDNNTQVGRPMELTCYRRNLFQISGSIVLNRGIKSMVNEQGQQIPLYDLTASLSALESIEGKSTEIISVPWKTSAGSSSEDKAGAAPPKWPLDLSMNPELDPNCVTIPIAWKRLQFKHATANNGRRKGLQQHYVIQINLMATLATGENVKLAEIQSGPIIVRGRSPRNFDSRKDVPLNERKIEPKEPKQRTTSDASSNNAATPVVKVDPGVTSSQYKFYALNALQQPLDLPDWTSSATATPLPIPSPSIEHAPKHVKKPTSSHQNTPTSSSSNFQRPPVPKARWKSESRKKHSPQELSLADDEYGRVGIHGSLGAGLGSPVLDRDGGAERGKRRGAAAGGGVGGGVGLGAGSPVESADLLYEYFPLSVDDWMPPVDAIYRPHVVHHTIVPPDLKAEQVKNKQKRYFSADE